MALGLWWGDLRFAWKNAARRPNLPFDTRTTDPFTYAAVIGGVIALTIAASIVPALRAMRVDPIIALRN